MGGGLKTPRRTAASRARSLSVGALDGEKEVAALVPILTAAFAIPEERARAMIDRGGRANVRVARVGRSPVACLVLLPMGQWFGGRRVPMTGVAAVAVAPEHRGRGVATTLMRAAVEEMASRGVALSVLYPATQPLYRRAGYESAGSRYEVRVRASTMPTSERTPAIRAIEPGDLDALHEAYRARAAATPGHLDRIPYLWKRVFEPWGAVARGYVLPEDSGRAAGYVTLTQKRGASFRYDLELSDLVATTPAAARRLLGFLADHASMAEDVVWNGAPHDPILAHLEEQSYRVTLLHHWMLRIVDVTAALSARGYAPGLAAELHLSVRDALLRQNAGRFVLEVAGGRGVVRRGGAGRLRLDVRGLAPLYSGHLSPSALRVAGLLDGPEPDLAAAAAVFSGPAPWMPDMF